MLHVLGGRVGDPVVGGGDAVGAGAWVGLAVPEQMPLLLMVTVYTPALEEYPSTSSW
jgi:hypothetical protein